MKRLILIGLILLATPVLANNVHVAITTDYEPRVDYTTLRVELWRAHQTTPESVVSRRPFRGTNISEALARLTTVDTGAFSVYVKLIDDMGTRAEADDLVIATGVALVDVVVGNNLVNIAIDRPTNNVTRDVTLFHDADENGVASIGDTMLYVVHIPGPMDAGTYYDDLGIGATLLSMGVSSRPDGVIEDADGGLGLREKLASHVDDVLGGGAG